jgi:hydrogenase maturation protease
VKTLLLGLGNELYGDDGVGIRVVRKIREEAAKNKSLKPAFEDVVIEECSLSGLALLDVIVGYDRLVLVDTIKRASPVPGRVHLLEEEHIRAVPGPSPHYVSIPQMIELGRKIGLHVPSRIRIVAVEAHNIHRLGEGLSPEVEERLQSIIQSVEDVLAQD